MIIDQNQSSNQGKSVHKSSKASSEHQPSNKSSKTSSVVGKQEPKLATEVSVKTFKRSENTSPLVNDLKKSELAISVKSQKPPSKTHSINEPSKKDNSRQASEYDAAKNQIDNQNNLHEESLKQQSVHEPSK